MPIAHINIIEGRSPEKRRELMKRVTEAIAESLDAPPASVRVLIHEVPAFHWAVGGEPKGAPPETDETG
ncbi:MAG: 4-oxalocrotonate tautomerase family protein [Hyphomonadaceae bacterium]|nr:4-oxalocrotonate tautomerase family protein [Hyphomonadaceae bacterium]